MKPYPEAHQTCVIEILRVLKPGVKVGDFGIQIAVDGNIWICIDGQATIRCSKKLLRYYYKGDLNDL